MVALVSTENPPIDIPKSLKKVPQNRGTFLYTFKQKTPPSQGHVIDLKFRGIENRVKGTEWSQKWVMGPGDGLKGFLAMELGIPGIG